MLFFILLFSGTSAIANQQSQYIRIAAIGTSLTRYGEWLPTLSEQMYKSYGISISYQNYGFPGKNIKYGLSKLDNILDSKADIYLIEFSVNDADLLKGVTLSESRELTSTFVQNIKIEYPNAKIILMKMNPVFGLRKWMRPRLESFYDLYDDLADDGNVDILDFYSVWQQKSYKKLNLNIPDGVHPTQESTIEVMIPVLLSYLSEEFCFHK
ncbi:MULTISPECIES: SGNH/GDSL hydrolase family protein [unclassified Endozoicomonas]|uniref:SGNH/GDSL hydrolase family protein n=1 Tax=unclassified Endozoicomonas TaxID=2644528 RepID=UPI003BB7EEBE